MTGRVVEIGAGELRFFEHALAERGPLRMLQRLAAPVYSRLPDGRNASEPAPISCTQTQLTAWPSPGVGRRSRTLWTIIHYEMAVSFKPGAPATP
jgi:hypothetical protein